MPGKDQIFGCLLGGALGDACGGAYENQPPPFDFRALSDGRLSDDTQLTLATCEAIIAANGRIDPAQIAAHFAAWHRAGRVTGIGASTLKALTELVAGGHWALVGRKGEHAAGNGAAMRIAPLAFFLDPQKQRDKQLNRHPLHPPRATAIGGQPLAVPPVLLQSADEICLNRQRLTRSREVGWATIA